MFTKKFEVQVGGELYGMYANVRVIDGHCKKCKIAVPVTELVDVEEVTNEDTMVPVSLGTEKKLVEQIKKQVLKESMFHAYCGRHAPEGHFPS